MSDEVKWIDGGITKSLGCEYGFPNKECREPCAVMKEEWVYDNKTEPNCLCKLHDEMLAEDKAVECKYEFDHKCDGEVKEYNIIFRSTGAEYKTATRCQHLVDSNSDRLIYTPIDEVKPVVKLGVGEISFSIEDPDTGELHKIYSDRNAAMMERDNCASVRHVMKPDEWEAAMAKVVKEALQSKAVAHAWTRSSKLPRIVGFDPHIPRGE